MISPPRAGIPHSLEQPGLPQGPGIPAAPDPCRFMTPFGSPSRARPRAGLGLALACLWSAFPVALRAQQPGGDGDPVLPRDPALGLSIGSAASSTPPARTDHIRLFRIQPGFLSDPVGLLDDDDTKLPDGSVPPAEEDGPDWLQVAVGSDLPYFELRQRGDPGGIGYYRVNTQVKLVDTGTTCASFAVQAWTPAGIQFGGLPDGPTVFSTALGLYQALGDGTAIQGFLGKNMPLLNAGGAPLQRNMQCGLALQRSLDPAAADGFQNVYLSLGALGQYHAFRDTTRPAQALLEVLPGLHWQVSDNWWMSGTLVVPAAHTTHVDPGQWQFTCSFRY